jgi:hypothetical protein
MTAAGMELARLNVKLGRGMVARWLRPIAVTGFGALVMMIAWQSQLSKAEAAESILGAIERKAKTFDRSLCKTFTSAQCRKGGRKEGRKEGERRVQKEKTTKAKAAQKPSAAMKAEPAKPKPPAATQAAEKQMPIKPQAAVPKPVERPKTLIATKKIMDRMPQSRDDGAVQKVTMAAPPQTAPAKKTPARQTDEKTQTSHAACLDSLVRVGASFKPADMADGQPQCSVENPVQVNSVAFSNGAVKLPDQPVLSCEFAQAFAQWIAEVKDENRITAIWTGPGFQCRGRNGDSSAKLSEHGHGNAVDIERIKLAGGAVIQVKDALNPVSPAFAPLKALRASACSSFTTVLGPGANTAHASHFHFDRAPRKGGYRICE